MSLQAEYPKPMRFTQLDVIRAAAVFAVACCHIYPALSRKNPLLAQHWVMQYISLISGVTMALGNSSPCKFSWRLLAVLALGMLLNAIPMGIRHVLGRDFLLNIMGKGIGNTLMCAVMQFWYVLILLLVIGLMSPLKFALKQKRRVYTVSYGCFALTCCLGFGRWARMGVTISEDRFADYRGVNDLPLYAAHMFGAFGIVCIADVFRSRREDFSNKRNSLMSAGKGESYVGWFLMVYMVYMVALVVDMKTKWLAECFVYPQLMLLGFTLYRNPLRFRESLQSFLQSTWPFVVFLCYLLSMDLQILPHQVPETGLFDRCRFCLTNFLFMAIFGVCFAPCAGEKENLAAPSWRLGEHEKIGWIAMWSLIVYVFHWALWDCVNILLPGSDKNYRAQTLMAISLLALALPFHLSWQKYKVLGEDFKAELLNTPTRTRKENRELDEEEATPLLGVTEYEDISWRVVR